MALERQIIELPFFQGIDSKTDAKQIPLGKLLVLQNAVFTSPGKLQKRNGYTALTTNILGGGTISGGAALFTRSNELCMTDTSSNLYSYDQSNTAWVSKGKMPSVTASVASLSNPAYSAYAIDMAVSGTLQCCVYELYDQNATGSQKKGLGYTVVDSTTGQVVVPPSTLDATATSISPRVVTLGTNFVAYYLQGDLTTTCELWGKTLSTTTPNAGWSAATKLSSGTTTSAPKISSVAFQIDACVSGTNGYISFNNRSDGTTIFQTTSVAPLTVNATKSVATTSSRVSCVFPDVSGDIVLGYATATAASAAVFDSTLVTTRLAASVIENSTTGYVTITGTSTATNTCVLYVGSLGNTSSTQVIRKNTLTTASYTVGTASSLIRSLAIGGKAFTYSGAAYLPAWFSTNSSINFTRVNSPQACLYLLDSSGNVLSKALAFGVVGALAAATSVSSAIFYQLGSTSVSGNTVTTPQAQSTLLDELFTYPFGGFVVSGLTVIKYQYGAAAVSFNFSDTTNNYLRGQLANAIHTSGGILQMYDGQNVVEHGFLVYPEAIAGSLLGSGGSMTAGVHQAIVTYEWVDGQGQLHRSTPSVASSFTAVNNDVLTLVIPTLRITAKSNVMINVYLTAANLTTFYQVSNFNANGSLFNDKTVDTVSFVITLADSSITQGPQLYTTGNVLQNAPCNPAGPMVVHRNRLFVVDSTNPTQVWYSKLVSPPAPVEFSGFQILNIDPKGGPITALASLDDKLIIFKSDRIFMVLGQGPDSTGNQNDFTDAIPVSSDTGCAVPKSVVVVPDGIMFQSPKGIYQLSRALQTSYIGAPVEGLLVSGGEGSGGGQDNIVATALTADQHQVRFATNDQNIGAIVYDYVVGQWSIVKSASKVAGVIDAAVWAGGNGACLFLIGAGGNAGSVFRETEGTWPDSDSFGSAAVPMSATTGWIKLSGLQGFQRAWRLLVLGDYKSPHTLTVTVAYNYNAATAQTFNFAVASNPAPYQFRCHLAQQKCEAIQITISDSAQSGSGESMSLSGIALEVGLKKGPYRLTAAQSG